MVSLSFICFLAFAFLLSFFILVRKRFINPVHRAPVGTPSKPEGKFRLRFSRSVPTEGQFIKGEGAQNLIKDPEVFESMSSKAGVTDACPSLSQRDVIVDESGTPRSSAPISLEDLVRFKPGRERSGKGGKWTNSIDFQDDTDVSKDKGVGDLDPQNRDVERQMPSLRNSHPLVPYLSSNRNVVPAPQLESTLRSSASRSFPKPREDGDFHSDTLPNGDLSVYQWSEPDQKWSPLGQIGQSDVSLFTRFVERAYTDNRSDAENWKLYKNHIVATVRHLSSKRLRQSEPPGQAPVLKPNSSYETQLSGYFNPFSSFAPVPATTTRYPYNFGTSFSNVSSNLNETTPTLLRHNQSYLQSPSAQVMSKGALAATSPSNSASPLTNIIGRHYDHEELGRKRNDTHKTATREQDGAADDSENTSQQASSLSDRATFLRSHQPPTEPAVVRSISSDYDLRRTVLHDPLKLRSISLQDDHEEARRRYQKSAAITVLETNRIHTRNQSLQPISYTDKNRASKNPLKNLVLNSEPDPLPPRPFDFIIKPVSSVGANPRSMQPIKPGFQFARNVAEDNFQTMRVNGERRKCDSMEDSSQEYKDSVETFWNSGRTRFNRQMAEVDQLIMTSSTPVPEEARAGLRVLFPAFEALQDYKFSRNVQAAGGRDHFASFAAPPTFCVDRRQRSNGITSLFHEQT